MAFPYMKTARLNLLYASVSEMFLVLSIHFYHKTSLLLEWITSCRKNRMTTHVITLWRVDVTSLTTPVPTVRFLLEFFLL